MLKIRWQKWRLIELMAFIILLSIGYIMLTIMLQQPY